MAGDSHYNPNAWTWPRHVAGVARPRSQDEAVKCAKRKCSPRCAHSLGSGTAGVGRTDWQHRMQLWFPTRKSVCGVCLPCMLQRHTIMPRFFAWRTISLSSSSGCSQRLIWVAANPRLPSYTSEVVTGSVCSALRREGCALVGGKEGGVRQSRPARVSTPICI
jgi:hypothetical protein